MDHPPLAVRMPAEGIEKKQSPCSRLEDELILKVSQDMDSTHCHHHVGYLNDPKDYALTLPRKERSLRNISMQVCNTLPHLPKKERRTMSNIESELPHVHSKTRSHRHPAEINGDIQQCRHSSTSRHYHTCRRVTPNDSCPKCHPSSLSDEHERSHHHHHHHHHHKHYQNDYSRDLASGEGDRRSRTSSHAHKRSSRHSSSGGKSSSDPEGSVNSGRHRIVMLIIGAFGIFILVMCVMLVAVTLSLSPAIDELVRKENEEILRVLVTQSPNQRPEVLNQTLPSTTATTTGQPG